MDMENNPVYGLTDQVYEEIPVKKRVEQAHSEESTRQTKERLSYKKFGYGTVAILATLLLLVGSGSIIYLVYSLQNLSSEFSRFKQIRNEMQAVQETQTLLDSNQTMKQIQQELLQLHESINVRLTNITAVQTQQYHECKQTAVVLSDTIQQQLYHTMQIQLNSTNSTMEAIQELQGRQHNSSQTIEQIQLEIMGLHESIDAKMANITAVQAQQYHECKQTTVALNNTTQDLQQQLYQTIQTQLNSTNSSRYAIQELHEHQHNSSQIIEQIQLELMGLHKSINARMANITTIHTQQYLECKQTAVALNEQTQRNLSQQIELQTVQMSEVIHTLQQQVNQSSGALQMDIENIQANLTTSHTNIDHLRLTIDGLLTALNTSTSDETPTTCEGLPPPANGEVSVAAGPNSLSHGLGSVATYGCNPGYAPVGKATRVCEDTLGGTVTTGIWSGVPPTCQDIHCSGLAAPANGSVLLSNQSLIIGTTATYSCDTGFILVGERNRTCQDRGGQLLGMWSETNPRCEVILCSELSPPENGTISLNSGVTQLLGVGTTATYSCDSGFVLVGQTNRTCQNRGGQLLGIWSGTRPRCEVIIRCGTLTPPSNGGVSISLGTHRVNLGVGSVATYSCDPGYILLGFSTRSCVDPDSDSVGTWTGVMPSCQANIHCYSGCKHAVIIRCGTLTPPNNGGVSISLGTHGVNLGVGSVATYSCDPGYILLGSSTRSCVDPDSDSVGTWTGVMPSCQVILCSELSPPENGTINLNSGVTQLFGVGTTATYSCDSGLVLVGDAVRTCQGGNSGTVGQWTGSRPTCATPNRPLIDCQDTTCRFEQLVCPEQENCTVYCNDSRQYACFQTDLFCPSTEGDCTLNCDESYACVQANITCPQGNCTVNCENDHTCLSSATRCSGENCLINCERRESCFNSNMECTNGNCRLNCEQYQACNRSTITCSGGNCLVDCQGFESCQYLSAQCQNGNCTLNGGESGSLSHSTVSCPPDGLCLINCTGDSVCQYSQFTCPSGGNCVFNFQNENRVYSWTGYYTSTICQENSTCSIYCTHQTANIGWYWNSQPCSNSHITCPTESGDCTVQCSGYEACQYSTIVCGRSSECLSCSGQYSCSSATITLPNPSNDIASLECIGSSSCWSASITCPENNTCSVGCTGSSSCQYASITCPENNTCSVGCTETYTCQRGTINCPRNGNCAINCNDTSTCNGARFICPENNNCTITCSGANSCQSILRYGSTNMTIICPANHNCTINCDGQRSCNNARVTCPIGDYSCNILCTDPLSCSNLSITNTHNVYLQCCGGPQFCAGTTVAPSSTECPYMTN